MARAADLNASPEVEATALDITMLLREAKQVHASACVAVAVSAVPCSSGHVAVAMQQWPCSSGHVAVAM